MLKFDKRFARQYCFGPTPKFLLAAAYPSIARRFSGPNITSSNSAFGSRGNQLRESTAGPGRTGIRDAFCVDFAIQHRTKFCALYDLLVR